MPSIPEPAYTDLGHEVPKGKVQLIVFTSMQDKREYLNQVPS